MPTSRYRYNLSRVQSQSDLSWRRPSVNEDFKIIGFAIERSEDKINWVISETVHEDKTQAEIHNLSEEEEYNFRVSAITSAGNGYSSKLLKCTFRRPFVVKERAFNYKIKAGEDVKYDCKIC